MREAKGLVLIEELAEICSTRTDCEGCPKAKECKQFRGAMERGGCEPWLLREIETAL